VGRLDVVVAGEGLQLVVASQEGATGVQCLVGVFPERTPAGRVAGLGVGDGAASVADLLGELVLGFAGGLAEGRELAAEGPFGLRDRLGIDHAVVACRRCLPDVLKLSQTVDVGSRHGVVTGSLSCIPPTEKRT
jgi:hypothetical protein